MSVEPESIAAVHSFNRFYTREISGLRGGLFDSPFTLPEARILMELDQNPGVTAGELGRQPGMDQGYVRRTVSRLSNRHFVEPTRSQVDGRRWHLNLTEKGRQAAQQLDLSARQEAANLLSRLVDRGCRQLLESMDSIRSLLTTEEAATTDFTLRTHRIGDMGWIVQRHAEIYFDEYGWDATFEALIADIVAAFIRTFDPEKERCWIAEVNGQRVGSVTCVRVYDRVAKLRLLFVDPAGRGRGIGRALVEECVSFAHSAGYEQLVLWTQSNLIAARETYRRVGFVLETSEANHSFGQDLVSETWRLTLT